jgi:SAM-dependent methyltransferase
VSDPRTRVVRDGYDLIGERFIEWRDGIIGDPRRWWADQLIAKLSDEAHIVDLGCGSGDLETQLLAERFRVTGVDISREQIRRARENVPNADFIEADFTTLDLPMASFDAVVAFYSFNHVPRDLLAGLFARVGTWLVPDGFFLVALGIGDTPGWTGDFLGAPTYFSSFPQETNRRLLEEACFEPILDEVVTFLEPDGEVSFQWVLAQK